MRKKILNSRGFTYNLLKILLGTCHYSSDALIVLQTAKAPGPVSKMEICIKKPNKQQQQKILEGNNCSGGKLLLFNSGFAERGTAEWRLVNLAAEHVCLFTPDSECQGGPRRHCWGCKQHVRREWRGFAGRLPSLLCVSSCSASPFAVCGAEWSPEL